MEETIKYNKETGKYEFLCNCEISHTMELLQTLNTNEEVFGCVCLDCGQRISLSIETLDEDILNQYKEETNEEDYICNNPGCLNKDCEGC